MTTQEDLRKAADLLDEHGLCQGQFTTEDGRICLLQSLRLAADFNEDRINRAARRIMEHDKIHGGIQLDPYPPYPQGTMCEINNRSGQTKEKLTAMLREIADEPIPAEAA